MSSTDSSPLSSCNGEFEAVQEQSIANSLPYLTAIESGTVDHGALEDIEATAPPNLDSTRTRLVSFPIQLSYFANSNFQSRRIQPVPKPQGVRRSRRSLQSASSTTSGKREDLSASGSTHGSGPPWSDPKSSEWDVHRVLNSDELLAPDSLLSMPPPNHTYLLDGERHFRDPDRHGAGKRIEEEPHPKLAAHIRNGTDTPALRCYYANMPHYVNLPLAGISRDWPNPVNSGVRGLSAESSASSGSSGSPFNAYSHVLHEGRFLMRDFVLQEVEFHSRPSIKIPMPDHIKAILVDDWENVTKNQQLVPLPHHHPVNVILNEYLASEAPKRQPGSAQADILEEVVAGLKEYFEKCLGRILLYR